MSRTFLTLGISMILAFAFLAACNGDDSEDDSNGADEDQVTETEDSAEEDEEATPEEDGDEEATPGEGDDESTDDEEATPEEDSDEAADDEATPEEGDDEATDDGEDTGTGETVTVTLSEDGIEIDSPIEAGTVELEVTNDGDGLHGVAIQEASGGGSDEEGTDDEDAEDEESEEAGGAFVASVTVGAGETKTSEVELEAGEYVVFCPIGEHREENEEEIELTVE